VCSGSLGWRVPAAGRFGYPRELVGTAFNQVINSRLAYRVGSRPRGARASMIKLPFCSPLMNRHHTTWPPTRHDRVASGRTLTSTGTDSSTRLGSGFESLAAHLH